MSAVYVRTHPRRIASMQKAVHLRACGASEADAGKQASAVIQVFSHFFKVCAKRADSSSPVSVVRGLLTVDTGPAQDAKGIEESQATPRYSTSDPIELPAGSYVASVQTSGFGKIDSDTESSSSSESDASEA